MPPPELMAPAGDRVCLQTAIQNGADAIYFGLDELNMRHSARNFTLDQLTEICTLCHSQNVKAYLTLNTIVFQAEMPTVDTFLQNAVASGVDAIIASDLGVIHKAHKIGLPVFISTQLSVANAEVIRFFHGQFGIRRFVLARECGLKEIADIRHDLGRLQDEIELEVFVHGAMCLSVSGRCFLSQFQHGTSANRGECYQPCRREYEVRDTQDGFEYKVGQGHIMSPQDLCTLPFLEKLLEAGIHSFKIEGRMRKADYVACVVSSYRQVIDHWQQHHLEENFSLEFEKLKSEKMLALNRVYNRGFGSGFFMGRPMEEWTKKSHSLSPLEKTYVGKVSNFYKKIQVAELTLAGCGLQKGEELLIQGDITGLVQQVILSMQIDHHDAESAEKGQEVAIQLLQPVRRGDEVYVLRQRTGLPNKLASSKDGLSDAQQA